MRTLTLLLSLSLLAAAAVGCTTPAETSDDPTAGAQGFLEACEADAACADDLTCESGVCTRACDAADPCDAPGAAGYCGAEDAAGRAFCEPLDPSCPEPGPMPDFAQCPPGQHAGLEPAADGCPAWGCYPDASCEPLGESPPAQCPAGQELREVIGADGCPAWGCVPADDCPVYNRPECAADERLVNRTDDNGCVYPECEPITCPPIAAPPADFCPEGQHIVETTGEDGCMDWGCAPDACPEINIPECPADQMVEQSLDADGCPQLDCVLLECPPVQALSDDDCPEDHHVVEITSADGCVRFDCAPDDPTECPQVAAPPADSCPEGQRVIEITNAQSCPDWGCTTDGCEDVQEPEVCFDGQPPHRRGLTANGCTVLTCDAERSFDCGPDMACSFDIEFCSVIVPGVEGADPSYSCAPLPEACLEANSCQCLQASGAWSPNTGSCEDSGAPPGSASLTVTLFAP